MYIVGALAYGVFLVWKVVYVIGSVNEMRAAGKIAMRQSVDVTPGGTQIGVAMSYC